MNKKSLKLKTNSNSKSAFSLLELSIVILIIGILLIGVIGAKHLIKKSRITTAQNLTVSSPINGILDNSLWLESSLDYKAFSNDSNTTTSNDSGNALGDGDYIENWNDNSYNQDKKSIVKVGNGPTYANTINNVQAVKFAGSDDDYLEITDASFLNNTDYTIFVLEKRLSNSGDNYFIGDSSVTTDNETLILGYSADTSPIHSQGSSNNYSASIEGYASYSDKPRLFTFVSDSIDGKKIYINGVLAKESNDTSKLSNITSLPIGKGYDGEIGEIVIFTRALKSVERKDVEDYIGKKWNNKINRDVISNCTTGTVTNNGCDNSCSFSINGISETSLASGSSQTYSCGTGYTGSTPEYSCTSGVLSPSASSTDCSDNGCASGYIASSGSCVQACTINVTGSSTTSVASGSTSVSCNQSVGYEDTYTFSACSAGNTVTGTCSCKTGYTGAGCTACATGYTDFDSNGTCEQKCTITGQTGVADGTLVESGATSYDCDADGAIGGTITHDCTNGTADNITNNCIIPNPPTCSGGNTVDTTTVPGQKIHIFTSSGTLTCSQGGYVQTLIVAGGGGSAARSGYGSGAGAGGGGVIYLSSLSLSATSYPITVGAGGSAGTSDNNGGNGGNSVFSSYTAIGGGGGGGRNKSGSNGGSGGGAGLSGNFVSPGSGTSGQGYSGGINSRNSHNYGAGGGGGAGGVGQNGTAIKGGDGGIGINNSITGSSTYYAGGGAAGYYENSGTPTQGINGSGGLGGGGSAGFNGTDGLGGGAGGGIVDNSPGKIGGSGIVIVRYTNP